MVEVRRMYRKEHIDCLNEMGVLTVSLLIMKFKMNIERAHLIMKCIVCEYENVNFHGQNRIYIEGRKPEGWDNEHKYNKINTKSKWKDIKKP